MQVTRMTNLLCIPQQTTIDIHIKEQLASIIESTSYQIASFFDDDLNKISQLRENISHTEPSEKTLRDLKEYLLCLQEISKKFPNDQVKFTWFNPLCQRSEGKSQYSLLFEEFNIYYNIGSQYSILALEHSDGSSQTLRTMCLYFQYSAGCFHHIVRHLNECEEPIFDYNSGNTLVKIMLAQAQECFWFKAILDGYKDSVVAKLAQQVSEYYQESLEFGCKAQLIRNDWRLHLESKVNYFKAVTYYRNGLSLGQRNNVGAQIKSLEIALHYLKKSNLPTKADFLVKIEESLQEVRRDNDFIYLQTVPSFVDPIKPAPIVSALPVESFLPKASVHIFKDLLPIGILDACSAYNERQEEYIRQYVIDPLSSLSKLLYDGLPKSERPPNLRNISEQEFEFYELSLNDLKFSSQNIERRISEIEQLLSYELEMGASSASNYGTENCDLDSTRNIHSDYYEELEKLKEYLNQGKKVDEETFSLFHTIDKKLITSAIKFPESSSPLVKQVTNIIKLREEYSKDVTANSMNHKILPKIISEYKKTGETDFEALFIEHLKFFDDDIKYVQQQKETNKGLSIQLQSQERDFVNTVKRVTPVTLYMEDLQYSRTLLEDVKRNLKDGAHFYQTLANSANRLLNEVQSSENSRRLKEISIESKPNPE